MERFRDLREKLREMVAALTGMARVIGTFNVGRGSFETKSFYTKQRIPLNLHLFN
jgi:hypothetical protein